MVFDSSEAVEQAAEGICRSDFLTGKTDFAKNSLHLRSTSARSALLLYIIYDT